jgi:hypothetical protein
MSLPIVHSNSLTRRKNVSRCAKTEAIPYVACNDTGKHLDYFTCADTCKRSRLWSMAGIQ